MQISIWWGWSAAQISGGPGVLQGIAGTVWMARYSIVWVSSSVVQFRGCSGAVDHSGTERLSAARVPPLECESCALRMGLATPIFFAFYLLFLLLCFCFLFVLWCAFILLLFCFFVAFCLLLFCFFFEVFFDFWMFKDIIRQSRKKGEKKEMKREQKGNQEKKKRKEKGDQTEVPLESLALGWLGCHLPVVLVLAGALGLRLPSILALAKLFDVKQCMPTVCISVSYCVQVWAFMSNFLQMFILQEACVCLMLNGLTMVVSCACYWPFLAHPFKRGVQSLRVTWFLKNRKTSGFSIYTWTSI